MFQTSFDQFFFIFDFRNYTDYSTTKKLLKRDLQAESDTTIEMKMLQEQNTQYMYG